MLIQSPPVKINEDSNKHEVQKLFPPVVPKTKEEQSNLQIAVKPSRTNNSLPESSLPKKESCLEGLRPLLAGCFLVSHVLLLLTMIAMTIAIMVINFSSAAVGSTYVIGGASGIYQNLGVMPMSDIIFATSCPTGYELVDMGAWPGTYPMTDFAGTLVVDNDDSTGITTYDGLSSADYTVWKEVSLCVKRISQVTNSSSCPTGYTQCVPGVCAYGTDCGITEVHFESTTRTDSGWYSVYSNGTYINYRKDAGVAPISKFSIAQGQPTPCLNPFDYGTQVNYMAIVTGSDGCGRYSTFPGVSQIDSDLSVNIFSYQTWNVLPSTLPQFNSALGNQLGYLMSVPRLELQNVEACLTFNLQTFLDRSNELYSSKALTTGFVITILVLIGSMIITPGVEIHSKCPEEVVIGTIYVHLILIVILTIPPAIITASQNKDFEAYKDTLFSLSDSNCFTDSYAQLVITDFASILTDSTRLAELWLIFTTIVWGLTVIIAALFKYIYTESKKFEKE